MEAGIIDRLLLPVAVGTAAFLFTRALRLLSTGGALAAALLGGVLTDAGGWAALLPVLFFFLSASALSLLADRLTPDRRGVFAKGSRRDAFQVVANGGVAGCLALLWRGGGDPGLHAAFLGAVAAATADTWATEVGMLSGSAPVLPTTFTRVEPGRSGGVSAPGILAAGAGAALAAAFGASFAATSGGRIALAAALGGVGGSLIDSLLGATLQAAYACPRCGERTERRTHCGGPSRRAGGIAWVTNDVVNLAATAAGGYFAYLGASWPL